jgi:uncharacterized protein
MSVERDQEFVESVVKTIVEHPDDVQVTRTVDEMGVLLSLTVNKEDMGVVIGKEGRTAKAIRTLLRVLGAKNDARVNLKIVDPEGEEPVKKETAAEDKVEEEKPEVVEEVVAEEEPEAEPEAEEDEERPMADLEL